MFYNKQQTSVFTIRNKVMFFCCAVSIVCVNVVFPEPKPVYAQPGQPDVDLPVSPSDAPVPSAAHDDSILR